jgi:hypothetical protein
MCRRGMAKPVLEASAFRFGTSTASSIEDYRMYYSKRELWPMVIKAGFAPSNVSCRTDSWEWC